VEEGVFMRTVLLATDGSEPAERATRFAVELTKHFEAKLVVVYVAGNMDLSRHDIKAIERAEGNVADVFEQVAKQILSRAEANAHNAGIASIQTRTGWGDPAEQIIEIARRVEADTIVMGRRGLGRLSGLLVGSVSQKVASLAPCVVILVP
jgi:nucleotide-binding universal stress UspA family protein